MKHAMPFIGITGPVSSTETTHKTRSISSRLAAAIALLLCVVFTGCALQSDVRQIEERLAAAERRNVALQKELRDLGGDMQQFGQSAETKSRVLRDQSADLQVMADKLRNEIRMLTGRLEETDYKFNQRLTALERNFKRMTSQSYGAGAGTVAGSSGNSNRPLNTPLMPGTGSAAGLDPADLYKEAKADFDSGRYDDARTGFEAVLRVAPKTNIAGNAYFWLGQTYYQQKEYGKAILQYQEVVDNYPDSGKVPASLLKQGYAFANLGDRGNARLMFELLIQKYPRAPEVNAARDQLARLN